ncbi:MAG: hypothetical protein P9L99_12595 [Candidatus Lernaella stagnicola]|nr:hypothetical protein [Candidatus Lernaella stagnicola]
MNFCRLAIVLCLLLGFAATAGAVEEGMLALAPEAGYGVMTGKLGDMVAGDIIYGASMSYGVIDWLGVTGSILYGSHQQSDEDNTGEIELDHFVGGLGPRFNYNSRLVVPYAGLLGAMSFMKYKSKWSAGAKTLEDSEDAHGYGGLAELGIDFYLHDLFTLGLCGRGGYFISNLEFTHQDARGEEAGGYAYFAGTVRLSVIF